MSTLDWIFVALLSLAILFCVFSFIYFLFSIFSKKQLKKLERKRPKNKLKRKKLRRMIRQQKEQVKKQLIASIIFVLLAGLSFGSSYYASYYQKHTLNNRDSDAIVQGYYFISQIDIQLKEAKNSDNQEKLANNIKELSSRLASYGNQKAYHRLTLEGQQILNKQYDYMKQLGVNLAAQAPSFLGNQEKLLEFTQDLDKAKEQQKKVFKYFHINESALSKKK